MLLVLISVYRLFATFGRHSHAQRPVGWLSGGSPREDVGGDSQRSTSIARNQPVGGQIPVVQRIRIRYAKRGRLRFTSHRDFARAFERALRRARVPMAYSAGFSPHPKISYVGASPTGLASEAEYLEIGLASRMEPDDLMAELDAALPPGLDLLAAVEGGTGHLADLIDTSHWVLELPGVPPAEAERAVAEFLAADAVLIEKLTKNGRREIDCRAPVVRLELSPPVSDPSRTGVAGPESTSPY